MDSLRMKMKNSKQLNIKHLIQSNDMGWNSTWIDEDFEEEIENSFLPCGM
jgi:hypothetical protein